MKKDPKLAALLSILFPGLGHLYIGQYFDAVVFLVGAGILYYALFTKSSYLMTFNNPRSFLVWGALLFISLYSLIDAFRKTKQL